MIVLRAIAHALELPMTDLFPSAGARDRRCTGIVELIGRLPAIGMAGASRR